MSRPSARRPFAAARPRKYRLTLERLEDRLIPSVSPTGPEFLVNNTTTLSFQRSAATAMDADGDFVVVWESPDGDAGGVYAQRFNAAGVAQGGEFLVNTFTTGWQSSPAVAMDADGDFVVAWQSASQDGSGYGVYARRYNAAGVAQGGDFEFLVNTITTADQRSPAVAVDADGDFVVAWQSYGQDGSGDGIYARRYSAAGVAQDLVAPRVNTFTIGDQAGAAVAMDADGDFVVAWHS